MEDDIMVIIRYNDFKTSQTGNGVTIQPMYSQDLFQIQQFLRDYPYCDSVLNLLIPMPAEVINAGFTFSINDQNYEIPQNYYGFYPDEGTLNSMLVLMLQQVTGNQGWSYDSNYNNFRKKINFIYTEGFTFMTNHYWLAKYIGAVQGKVYQSVQIQGTQTQTVQLDLLPIFNQGLLYHITCSSINKSTVYKDGQSRMLLDMGPMNFQPGQRSILTTKLCNFMVGQIVSGLRQFRFTDENYMDYSITQDITMQLVINKPQAIINQKQLMQQNIDNYRAQRAQARLNAIAAKQQQQRDQMQAQMVQGIQQVNQNVQANNYANLQMAHIVHQEIQGIEQRNQQVQEEIVQALEQVNINKRVIRDALKKPKIIKIGPEIGQQQQQQLQYLQQKFNEQLEKGFKGDIAQKPFKNIQGQEAWNQQQLAQLQQQGEEVKKQQTPKDLTMPWEQ